METNLQDARRAFSHSLSDDTPSTPTPKQDGDLQPVQHEERNSDGDPVKLRSSLQREAYFRAVEEMQHEERQSGSDY